MSKRVLFLDDRSKRLHAALEKYSPPEYDLTLVCTVKECIKMISNEPAWDIISLDHDLGFEEFVSSDSPYSGMEVVRWINRNILSMVLSRKIPGEIIIHTSNEIAGLTMVRTLNKIYSLLDVRYERFEYG